MKIIQTALLSYGLSGRAFHAPFLTIHPGFQLIGAWERNSHQIQKDYPQVIRFSTLEEVLASDADLIVINTPTTTHFEYARQALESGKNIIVEKAFVTNTQEAIELQKLATKKNLILSVFQNRRWDSDFLTVKQVVESGVLGDLIEVQLSFDRYNPGLSPKKHKEEPSPGAGILKDLGPHIIDQSLVLFGMPEYIFADLRITRDNSVVDDYFEILLFYPKLRVRLHAGYFVRAATPAYIVHGKKGSFLKTRSDNQEASALAGKQPSAADWGKDIPEQYGLLHLGQSAQNMPERIESRKGNYLNYFGELYKSMTSNHPVPVTASDGINVMRIIDAAIASSLMKKVVQL
jgi:scyllo-inositol 2-dehydrogenase (NADP+)